MTWQKRKVKCTHKDYGSIIHYHQVRLYSTLMGSIFLQLRSPWSFKMAWKYWTFYLTSKKSKMYSQRLSKMTKSSLKRHDMAFSYEKYVAATTCLCHEEKIYKKFHCSILWTTKYQSNSNWLLWALFPLDKWVWFLKSSKTKESL